MDSNTTHILFKHKKLIILSIIHIIATVLFLLIFTVVQYDLLGTVFVNKYDELLFYSFAMAGLTRDVTFLMIPISTLIERWVSKNNTCLLFNIVIAVTLLVSILMERNTFLEGLGWIF